MEQRKCHEVHLSTSLRIILSRSASIAAAYKLSIFVIEMRRYYNINPECAFSFRLSPFCLASLPLSPSLVNFAPFSSPLFPFSVPISLPSSCLRILTPPQGSATKCRYSSPLNLIPTAPPSGSLPKSSPLSLSSAPPYQQSAKTSSRCRRASQKCGAHLGQNRDPVVQQEGWVKGR